MSAQPPPTPPTPLPERGFALHDAEGASHDAPPALRRWASIGGLALLAHAVLLASLSWWMASPQQVRVMGVTPPPGVPVHLSQTDRVEVAITLGSTAQGATINPLGARLLYMDDPRGPQVVATGEPDPDDPTKLWLRAPARVGTFRVWLAAGGVEPLLSQGFVLDGEWAGQWPSGDGQPGGDLVYAIEVLTAPPEPEELIVAKLIEEEEPQEAAAPAASAATASAQVSPPPSPPDLTPPTPPTPTPPTPTTPTPPAPTPPRQGPQ
jgi:hypothetical protein